MQVLGNLLSNAARHSPESSATRVSAVRQGVHVAVSVADEGRGIPADRLPHLFRKFSRIDAENQRPPCRFHLPRPESAVGPSLGPIASTSCKTLNILGLRAPLSKSSAAETPEESRGHDERGMTWASTR